MKWFVGYIYLSVDYLVLLILNKHSSHQDLQVIRCVRSNNAHKGKAEFSLLTPWWPIDELHVQFHSVQHIINLGTR